MQIITNNKNMYIAILNLTDVEVQDLMKIKVKKGFKSVDQMLTSQIKGFIASNIEVRDPNQSTISLDD